MVLSTLIMKPDINVKSISCGDHYTMYLTESGSVYGVGTNTYGQMGINNTEKYVIFPQLVEYFEANGDTLKGGRGVDSEKIIIKQVLANESTTYFLTNEGSVYSCGENNYGQLGIKDDDATTGKYKTPQLIEYFEENGDETKGGRGTPSAKIIIDKIIGGGSGDHRIFIDNNGKIYGVGANNYNQIVFGPNAQSKYNTPQEIIHFTTNSINIKQVACGKSHTVFLTDNGSVYSVGLNNNRQLGLGDGNNREEPTLIKYFEANEPEVPNGNGGRGVDSEKITIEEILSCYTNTFCKAEDGKIYVFGDNGNGQLGIGYSSSNEPIPKEINFSGGNIKQIVASNGYTIFSTRDNRVYSVGFNNHGQLGLGDTSTHYTLTEITSLKNFNIIQINCGINSTAVLVSKNNTRNTIINSIPLYEFTTHTFTNAGQTGRSGPNLAQCQSSYSSASWTQNTDYFNMTTQGVQLWTVPKDGYYEIVCYGASGGNAPPPRGSTNADKYMYGGKGVGVSSTIYLLRNQVLSIVVGQQGGTSAPNSYYQYKTIGGGGGGGSFVYATIITTPSNSVVELYCAGGGGGGAVHDNVNDGGTYYNGNDAFEERNNTNLAFFTAVEGYGGGSGGFEDGSGGGAGWLGDGADNAINSNYSGGPTGGHSRLSGWEGGAGEGFSNPSRTNDNNDNMSGASTGYGGFGGGSGVRLYNGGPHYPGSGGGYTGGTTSRWISGGGSSYYITDSGSFIGYGNQSEDGKVTITFLS